MRRVVVTGIGIVSCIGNTIKEVEDKHEKQNDDLNTNYKKEIKRLMKKHKDDPDALSKKLAEEFGIDHKD